MKIATMEIMHQEMGVRIARSTQSTAKFLRYSAQRSGDIFLVNRVISNIFRINVQLLSILVLIVLELTLPFARNEQVLLLSLFFLTFNRSYTCDIQFQIEL